jgi:hypothetical protein
VKYQHQRELYHQLRADKEIVRQAGRRLRDLAIADEYRGLPDKHRVFALTLTS